MKEITFTPLHQISDERGSIMHMLRSNQTYYKGFGEIYFSWINPGYIKGWTQHKIMTVNLAVPVGEVRFVVYDSAGHARELISGGTHYSLLTIPPGYWYGFQCLGNVPAMIANCASHPHDSAEMLKCELDDPSLVYEWPLP